MSFASELERIRRAGGNPFGVLNVDKGAAMAEVHSSYKKLVRPMNARITRP
jgi:hypothetical protein